MKKKEKQIEIVVPDDQDYLSDALRLAESAKAERALGQNADQLAQQALEKLV